MLKIEFGTGFLFVGDPPFTRENLLGVVKAEKEVDKSNDVNEEKKDD